MKRGPGPNGGFPVMEMCHDCHGDGKVDCQTCHGSGSAYNPDAFEFEPCDACHGTGQVQCPTCNGSGEIVTEDCGD